MLRLTFEYLVFVYFVLESYVVNNENSTSFRLFFTNHYARVRSTNNYAKSQENHKTRSTYSLTPLQLSGTDMTEMWIINIQEWPSASLVDL